MSSSTAPAAWGNRTDRILLALQEGPATAAELCELTDTDVRTMSSILGRLTRATKKMPKRVYVFDWCTTQAGERNYPRAIYTLGDRRDKPKPKHDSAANHRRSRAQIKARALCASGFRLARPVTTSRPAEAEKAAAAA